MKISATLSVVNQVEKSKFINSLDKVCNESASRDSSLAKKISNLDGQIKNASSNDIVQLFGLVKPHFESMLKDQLAMLGAQAVLITNILSRDGNCIARISWIENLYLREWKVINERSKEIQTEINNHSLSNEGFSDAKRFSIFYECLKEAYSNDERNNRESKITDDERSILNVLAKSLDVTADDQAAIEHLVDKIPKNGVLEALNMLREIGALFISKKQQTVYVADEIVNILNALQGKEVADKYFIRVLRTLSDAELSNILKNHRKKIRGVERVEKIKTIVKLGVPLSQVLSDDMYPSAFGVNDKKERLKVLISDLDLSVEKLGATLDDRVGLIISALNSCSDQEFNALSASGFKELFASLSNNFPDFIGVLAREFELERKEDIDVEVLRSLSVTPNDLLYVLSNDQIKEIVDRMGIKKRGNPRLNILDTFADATDKLIDCYGALARRDLATLKEQDLDISEADIGVKFEEVTKAIFEQLGLSVDEDVRKSINTAKDKADIIISLSEDDVIVGEAKTCKSGDFAKYSSTSRQVKSYVARCENIGKRVAQVLIVAPSFSTDFIESAEMDTEVNISLLEADGLKLILDAYRSRRNPKFSAKLFTKGGLLKAELISKNI